MKNKTLEERVIVLEAESYRNARRIDDIDDQFGLLRLPVHHAGWPRILGAVLVLAGAVLVQRF